MLNSGLLCLNKYKNEKKGCLCTTDVFPYDSVASMHFDYPTDFAQKKTDMSFDLITQYYHICGVLGFNGKIQLVV